MSFASPATRDAEPAYVCELCSTGIEWTHGGPYPPRWCPEHREQGGREIARKRQTRYRREALACPVEPAVVCDDCGTRLLWSSEHGLCRFCAVDLGLEAAA